MSGSDTSPVPGTPAPKSRMGDLKLRLLSALVLGPAVLLLVWLGGLPFAALVVVAGLGFLWEWLTITGTARSAPHGILAYLVLVTAFGLQLSGLPGMGLVVVLLGAALVWGLGVSAERSPAARWAAEGVVYTGLSMLSLFALREGSHGAVFLFYLLVVVWSTDVCAYFVGRFVGGPKLWRRVSPNKTWSGSLGGLGFAVAFAGLYAHLTGAQGVFGWMALAALLSAASQAGDLMESALKRRFSVKDSSHLIPGHGGIMDRIDGLVAAAILAALLGLAFGGSLMDPVSGFGLT